MTVYIQSERENERERDSWCKWRYHADRTRNRKSARKVLVYHRVSCHTCLLQCVRVSCHTSLQKKKEVEVLFYHRVSCHTSLLQCVLIPLHTSLLQCVLILLHTSLLQCVLILLHCRYHADRTRNRKSAREVYVWPGALSLALSLSRSLSLSLC
jgi:hypothetical protein